MEFFADHKFEQKQKCGSCVPWTNVFSQVLCRVFVSPYDSVRSVTSALSPGLRLDWNRSSRFTLLFVADRTFPSRSFRSCFRVSRRSRVLRVSWSSRWTAVFFSGTSCLGSVLSFVRDMRTRFFSCFSTFDPHLLHVLHVGQLYHRFIRLRLWDRRSRLLRGLCRVFHGCVSPTRRPRSR